MCTLAWGGGPDGFWAVFNRDEQRARPAAEPPALHPGRHGPLAYARDPQGGGTWFAGNARFAVALLNHYPAQARSAPPQPRSRGLLVCELAQADSAPAAAEQLERGGLDCYPPLHLFILAPAACRGFTWDGATLAPVAPDPPFWTTSSVDSDRVTAHRREQWRRAGCAARLDAEQAARLLRRTDPDDPARGFTMDRDDARTVSQIVFEQCPDRFSLRFYARDPDGPGFAEAVQVRPPRTAPVRAARDVSISPIRRGPRRR
jgi:hypothetical protein